jgi:hypothetical protein
MIASSGNAPVEGPLINIHQVAQKWTLWHLSSTTHFFHVMKVDYGEKILLIDAHSEILQNKVASHFR